jgi:hypothetical protein
MTGSLKLLCQLNAFALEILFWEVANRARYVIRVAWLGFPTTHNRGDCQTTRKSYKTEALVGWVVGWKESTNSETTTHSFPRTSFWIVSEWPIRELSRRG